MVAAIDHTSVTSKKHLRKTSQQKAFLLSSDKKRPNSLKLKQVAFDISNSGNCTSLVKHFGGKDAISSSLSKGQYLFGMINKLSKQKGKSLSYGGGKDAISSSLSKGQYLFGMINELSKQKGKSLSYEVQRDDSICLGSTSIELSCLIPTIILTTQLKMKANEGTS